MNTSNDSISVACGLEPMEPRLLLSGTWQPAISIDGASSTDLIGMYTSIALDDNEEPSVAYYDVTGQQLRYIEKAGASWLNPHQISVKEGFNFHDVGRYSSLAMDANGNPHISFYDSTSGNLMYTYWDPGPWSPAKIVDGQAPNGTDGIMGRYSSIALDSKGMAHIAYYDATNKRLMYASQTGPDTWEREVIDDSVGSVSEGGSPMVHHMISLAINQYDVPNVAYFDATEKNANNEDIKALKYGSKRGLVWEVQRVDPTNPFTHGWEHSLCLDQAGQPRIAYLRHNQLMYAELSDNGWDYTYVSGGYLGYLAMALDANGNPHIVFEDGNYNLRYMGYRDGVATNGVYPDGWTSPVLLDKGGAMLPGTGMYPSITIDSEGNTHVTCYQDLFYGTVGGALRYMFGEDVALPASPDIKVSVDYDDFSTEWFPSQTVQIPVTLTNIGSLPGAGAYSLELWYSDDGQLGNDTMLTSTPITLNLAPGQSKVFNLSHMISQNEVPGPYALVAKCIPAPAVGEANLDNNMFLVDGGVSWKMGTFDDKKDFALTIPDGQGNPVTLALKGGGYGYVQGGLGGKIELYDTNAKSVLTIIPKVKGAVTEIGSIEISGAMGGIIAPAADLLGSIYVSGPLANLVLRNVDEAHRIRINGDHWNVDSKLQCNVVLGLVNDCDLITNGVPIKSLICTNWLNNKSDIEAPWIGKLLVTGNAKSVPAIEGNFEANLKLNGAGDPKLTLGSAVINGDVNGNSWDIHGPIGTITVAQHFHDAEIGLGGTVTAMKSFKAGEFLDSEIEVGGSVDTFAVGAWEDSSLLANTLKNLAAGSFLHGKLELEGDNLPEGAVVLGKAVVGNIDDSYYDPDHFGWDIHGAVGAIVAKDVTHWSMLARGVKSITLGQVLDSAIGMDGTNKLTVASWNGGNIWAHGIGAIKTTDPQGMFNVDMELDGNDPKRPTIGSMSLAGNLGIDGPETSVWKVSGVVGALAVKGRVYHWNLTGPETIKSIKTGVVTDGGVKVNGPIGSIQAVSWDTGGIQAGVIGSVKMTGDKKLNIAASFVRGEIVATGNGALPGKPVIGKINIPALALDLAVQANGNVGDVTVGQLFDSQILLGSDGLKAGDASDFSDGGGGTNQYTLKSLNLLGYSGKPGTPLEFFDDSSVGAWNIATVKFSQQPSAASGRIEYHTIGKLVNPPQLQSQPDPFEVVVV